MARKLYIGVDGIARRVTKMYIGISGVARRVKKAYVGTGDNWARVFFYYSSNIYRCEQAPQTSVSRVELAGASAANNAVFAGGRTESLSDAVLLSTAESYDVSLTRTIASGLSVGRYFLSGISTGNYALMAGGQTSMPLETAIETSAVVDVYNERLTRSSATAMSQARMRPMVAALGNYVVIAGGMGDSPNGSNKASNAIDAYDSAITKVSMAPLALHRGHGVGASVGNYILLAGGLVTDGSATDTVDVYDESLTRIQIANLGLARYDVAGASNGTHTLFAGGAEAGLRFVEAFDSALTRTELTSFLTCGGGGVNGVGLKSYAVFSGGNLYSFGGSDNPNTAVNAFDETLTRSDPDALRYGGAYNASCCIGSYAMIADSQTMNLYSVR